MKLNESGAWGWKVAAVASVLVAFDALDAPGAHWIAFAVTLVALAFAYQGGKVQSRDALQEVLPYGRDFSVQTERGKIVRLELLP